MLTEKQIDDQHKFERIQISAGLKRFIVKFNIDISVQKVLDQSIKFVLISQKKFKYRMVKEITSWYKIKNKSGKEN